MFLVAARALADCVSKSRLESGAIFRPQSDLRQVSARVATSVIGEAIRTGVMDIDAQADVGKAIRQSMWFPNYFFRRWQFVSQNESNHIVIGIGSPHGDDVAGWLVADEVVKRSAPNLRVVRAADATGILAHLGGESHVWIVDACRSGNTPGTIQRWQYPEMPTFGGWNASTHTLSLTESLRLAANLGRVPTYLVVYAIELDDASPDVNTVSKSVEAAVPEVAQLVLSEIEQLCRKDAHLFRSVVKRSPGEVRNA